jgi:hypothetical protein
MGFVPWTCGIKANRFAFVSQTCHREVALLMG